MIEVGWVLSKSNEGVCAFMTKVSGVSMED